MTVLLRSVSPMDLHPPLKIRIQVVPQRPQNNVTTKNLVHARQGIAAKSVIMIDDMT